MASLRERIDAVRAAAEGAPRPRVLCLEWLDPLMPAGHWVPQMVELAGGVSEPIAAGEPSRKVPWEEMRALEQENGQLKTMVADLMLDNKVLKDINSRNW